MPCDSYSTISLFLSISIDTHYLAIHSCSKFSISLSHRVHFSSLQLNCLSIVLNRCPLPIEIILTYESLSYNKPISHPPLVHIHLTLPVLNGLEPSIPVMFWFNKAPTGTVLTIQFLPTFTHLNHNSY